MPKVTLRICLAASKEFIHVTLLNTDDFPRITHKWIMRGKLQIECFTRKTLASHSPPKTKPPWEKISREKQNNDLLNTNKHRQKTNCLSACGVEIIKTETFTSIVYRRRSQFHTSRDRLQYLRGGKAPVWAIGQTSSAAAIIFDGPHRMGDL